MKGLRRTLAASASLIASIQGPDRAPRPRKISRRKRPPLLRLPPRSPIPCLVLKSAAIGYCREGARSGSRAPGLPQQTTAPLPSSLTPRAREDGSEQGAAMAPPSLRLPPTSPIFLFSGSQRSSAAAEGRGSDSPTPGSPQQTTDPLLANATPYPVARSPPWPVAPSSPRSILKLDRRWRDINSQRSLC